MDHRPVRRRTYPRGGHLYPGDLAGGPYRDYLKLRAAGLELER
jgi:hypothetical protein